MSSPLLAIVVVVASAVACTGGNGAPQDTRDAGGLTDGPALSDAALLIDAGDSAEGSAPGGDAGADTGPRVCSGHCNPRTGDGCRDGACVLASGLPMCSVDVGSGAAGERCSVTADCAPGLACFQRSGEGRCADVCCPGDEAGCADGERCSAPALLNDGSRTDWGRCIEPRPCSIFQPEVSCDDGESCYIVSDAAETDCLPAGMAEVGGDCRRPNDCAPGLFCLPAALMCVRICGIGEGAPSPCPSEEGVCRAYAHSPTGTGLCTLEQML